MRIHFEIVAINIDLFLKGEKVPLPKKRHNNVNYIGIECEEHEIVIKKDIRGVFFCQRLIATQKDVNISDELNKALQEAEEQKMETFLEMLEKTNGID